MGRFIILAVALAALAAPASAANMCRTASLSCATTMPVGGYCECTARGQTEDGTVASAAPRRTNSTAGGCGAQPNSAGCR